MATATLNAIFPGLGPTVMAIGIMISTFGCANGLILAGARAYYAMARDRLFFRSVAQLNRAKVLAAAIVCHDPSKFGLEKPAPAADAEDD